MAAEGSPQSTQALSAASEMLGAPGALVSALGETRQTILAQVGFGCSSTPIEDSFCAHTVREEVVFGVPYAP